MLDFYLLIVFIVLGFVFGQLIERRHYKSIVQREKKLINLITTNSKYPLGHIGPIREVRLVSGTAVISIDYFKRIASSLRHFFGGNLRSYETLVDRARREAVLRLKESCLDAHQIINLRLETSSIYKGNGKQVGSVEVLAYATAIYIKAT